MNQKIIKRINLKELLKPYITRLYYNDKKIKKLAETIKEHGLLQNIILNMTPKSLKPIAGTRRLKALEYLGVETIPSKKFPNITLDGVKIIKVSDEEAIKIALIENEQREDLSGVERGITYKKLMCKGFTQKQIGDTIKKSQEYVADKIRLLRLPDKVQEAIITHVITDNHGRLILSLRSLWKSELKAGGTWIFDKETLEKHIQSVQCLCLDACIKNKWSTTKLAEEIETLRWIFIRCRQHAHDEKRNGYSGYMQKPSDWGRPVHAIDLCDIWGLNEDAWCDGDNFEFVFKYAKKHGLNSKDEEIDEKTDRTYINDWDTERELKKQIKELEELEQVRNRKKYACMKVPEENEEE